MSRDLEKENRQLIAMIKSLIRYTVLQNAAGVELEVTLESALIKLHFLLKDVSAIEPKDLSEMLQAIRVQLTEAAKVAATVSLPWRFDENEI